MTCAGFQKQGYTMQNLPGHKRPEKAEFAYKQDPEKAPSAWSH